MQNAALFVPEEWREELRESFLSGSVFDKEGKKLESRESGFLLLSNWHFLDEREQRVDERLANDVSFRKCRFYRAGHFAPVS